MKIKIERYIDYDIWNRDLKIESLNRDKIKYVVDNWNNIIK